MIALRRATLMLVCSAAVLLTAGCSFEIREVDLTEPSSPTSTSATPSTATTDTAAAVVALVVDRLRTAPQVAAAKAATGAPVDDPVRERAVLADVDRAAAADERDRRYVRAVFSDQIEANKIVQRALLQQWSGPSPTATPPAAPDLTTTVRPVLDAITPELVAALGDLAPHRAEAGCVTAVRTAVEAARVRGALRDALPVATAHLCR